MMNFLNALKTRLQTLLKGRYGNDQLNLFILSITIFFGLLSTLFESMLLSLIATASIFLCYYRIFSKQLVKRTHENQKFLKYYLPVKTAFKKRFYHLKMQRTHKYLTCKGCGQKLRVPRGKGKICITCPKCKEEIHVKS